MFLLFLTSFSLKLDPPLLLLHILHRDRAQSTEHRAQEQVALCLLLYLFDAGARSIVGERKRNSLQPLEVSRADPSFR